MADALDFEAIETAARRQALAVAARAVEQRFNADTSDYSGPRLPCSCGQSARYAGRREKTFISVLGSVTFKRAYYHCEACRAGLCPRDRALGLEDGSLSPGVLRMVGQVGARVSFEEGHELLHELASVQLPTKHVERAAEALGREIAADERSFVELPAADETATPTLYLGMDGTGVPMRASEIKGRAGKQPDGSAKTREVKLVTVWTAQSTDEHGAPVRDSGSITYSAALESAASCDTDDTPSQFAQRADREARRRGFDRAKRRVVLGDGAPWIWNLTEELFPGAIQIVDIYHAKGHLSGPSSAETSWMKGRSAISSRRYGCTSTPTTRPASASHTSSATRTECDTPSSGRRACVSLPESSRPAAKSPSAPGSNVPACTGPSAGPTPSSRCAAASLAAASQTSGSADQQPEPRPALELISQN